MFRYNIYAYNSKEIRYLEDVYITKEDYLSLVDKTTPYLCLPEWKKWYSLQEYIQYQIECYFNENIPTIKHFPDVVSTIAYNISKREDIFWKEGIDIDYEKVLTAAFDYINSVLKQNELSKNRKNDYER